MKAYGLTQYGGPEVLHAVDLPDPHAGEGEVRVQVRAAGLNPADVMLRDGSLAAIYEGLDLPYIPGMDIAGVIDEVGDGVSLPVGSSVVAVVDNTGSYGGYSQYVVVPESSVTPAPSGAAWPAAASFLMNALTARNALDELSLPPGSTVLVTGAAGAVGNYAVALAHADGLRVIALAGAADEQDVRDLGADVFVARGDDAVEKILEAAPGGVAGVIDTALLYEAILAAVRDGGTLIDLRFWDAQPERGIKVVHANVRSRVTDHAAITALREQVEQGVLSLRVAQTYPADSVADAHAHLDRGGLRGRIVLTFPDA